MTPRIMNDYLHIIDGWHKVAIHHEEIKEYDEAINAYRNIIVIYNYINYKDSIEPTRLVINRLEQDRLNYINSIPKTTIPNESTTKIHPTDLEFDNLVNKELTKYNKRKNKSLVK